MLQLGYISPIKNIKNFREEKKLRFNEENRLHKEEAIVANTSSDKKYTFPMSSKFTDIITKQYEPKKLNSIKKEETDNKEFVIRRETFKPEIHLGNKIIEDLTFRHKSELMTLIMARSKKVEKDYNKNKEEEEKQLSRRNLEIDLKSNKETRFEINKKSVSFLEDKLKSGFTNAGFVLSPSSISSPDPNKSVGGIINSGFESTPVSDCEGKKSEKKKPIRPKPIIVPTKEFLKSLEARAEEADFEDDANAFCNEAFIQSTDSSAIDIEEQLLEREKSKNKVSNKKKRGGLTNHTKKLCNQKSFSNDKENEIKQKKRHRSILNRKKRDEKCCENAAAALGGIFNNSLHLSSEDETIPEAASEEKKKKKKSRKFSKFEFLISHKSASASCKPRSNTPTELKRTFDEETQIRRNNLSWKHSSMPKLPTRDIINDAQEVEGFRQVSDLHRLNEKGMDFLVDGFRINNRKKLDKINKINIHLHALFSAIENGNLEKVRTILESSDVDVNNLNGDNLTPLDVAVLTNHRSLVKMMVAFGAQEGNQFSSPEKLENHLRKLSLEAEKKIQELSKGLLIPEQGYPSNLNNNRASFSIISHYPSASITCHGGSSESEKELLIWERRLKGLKKMLLGFHQTKPPDVPYSVAIDVTSTDSITVRYQNPEHEDSSVCTRYKIQWSESENFEVIAGEKEIMDVKCLECSVAGLTKGKRYWFRVGCGNLKGYGNFKISTPPSLIPSSWRDIQGREPRFLGRLLQLEELFSEIKNLRPETASAIPDFSDQEKPGELLSGQRRTQKKKTIKQLFTVAGKFQKHLKRGVYLACLFFHDDKILVTNEDFLPTVEVDETYPSSIYSDLHWFMKVACTWSDVKSLKQDMEKNLTSTTSHFRIKLLQAAQQMQSNLCTQDLGQLYYKPIRDAQGTLVFCSINSCPSLKTISVLNLKWTLISKVQKKIVASEESNVGELLMASIQPQIAYHQFSNLKLSRGLYLGYLKMKSSVDLIQIIVPTKTPNVLPHCKIRNNPHVSSEEWEWLKRINSRHKSLENLQSQVKDLRELHFVKGTEQQQIFIEQIANTAKRLFSYMDVSLEDAMLHRLYDVEVVDLNSDVSFLIMVPPVSTSCSVPGQKLSLLERGDLMSVSLQVFEMVHLRTYQPEVISRYSRLSCILELDIILAQHSHREAFSSSEVQITKDRLSKLQELQIQLNMVWKSVRWIMDVITFARDRNTSPGNLQSTQKLNVQNNLNKMGNIQTSSMTGGMSSCGVQTSSGVSMKHLLALSKKKDSNKKSPSKIIKLKCLKENHHHVKCEKRTLLQIPDAPKDPKISKSNGSRGSWPGPGAENSSSLLESSFSKSEQNLNALGTDGFEGCCIKNSDYSSYGHLAIKDNLSGSSTCSQMFDNCERNFLPSESMYNIGNRMLYSRSEDQLLINQDLGSFKQPNNYKYSCHKPHTMTTMSVSATSSPLLPQRNLYGNTLKRTKAGSFLSVANTNTSGSLHSLSSDESTTAVVSLPVTTPFFSNLRSSALNSEQHSASLMSLAKPIIPSNFETKPKIPATVSLNSLTELASIKKINTSNQMPSRSILSGNTIPVNINQKPLKSTNLENLPDTGILNQHVSSSLSSFSKHSGSEMDNLLKDVNPFPISLPGKQKIQSPVKSPIKAVSPTDTLLFEAQNMKRFSSSNVDPFFPLTLPSDIDFLQHPGLALDCGNSSISNGLTTLNPVSLGELNCESDITQGFLNPGSQVSRNIEKEENAENLVPSLTSGVLQVYAAYDTGLAPGTSLKLHVTPRTSAREVVDLVVKQLNMAVLLKGKDGPIYSAEKLKNFCMVAVVGARERCLRDDFKPLQLQNPWKKGRLYVRMKQDVLAALEHSSRQPSLL